MLERIVRTTIGYYYISFLRQFKCPNDSWQSQDIITFTHDINATAKLGSVDEQVGKTGYNAAVF
ncbi:MAG: hypothetical protein ACRD8Z_23660 [Nitrososphaeraceae archaeon]